jgi:hypothetical protein
MSPKLLETFFPNTLRYDANETQTSGTCALLNEALKKGDLACKATYLDVATTAQTIFDVCTDTQGEHVGGSLGLIGKPDCLKVSIVKNS